MWLYIVFYDHVHYYVLCCMAWQKSSLLSILYFAKSLLGRRVHSHSYITKKELCLISWLNKSGHSANYVFSNTKYFRQPI